MSAYYNLYQTADVNNRGFQTTIDYLNHATPTLHSNNKSTYLFETLLSLIQKW